MKNNITYYKQPGGRIVGLSGDQLPLLTADMTPLTESEISQLFAAAPVDAPTVVTMAQARKALRAAGLLEGVAAALEGLTGDLGANARIDWEFQSTVRRGSPTVVALSSAMGLTDAMLDQLFTAAAEYP